jgi:hypothetical protein
VKRRLEIFKAFARKDGILNAKSSYIKQNTIKMVKQWTSCCLSRLIDDLRVHVTIKRISWICETEGFYSGKKAASTNWSVILVSPWRCHKIYTFFAAKSTLPAS